MGCLVHVQLSSESKSCLAKRAPGCHLPQPFPPAIVSLAHSSPLPLGLELGLQLRRPLLRAWTPDGGGDEGKHQDRIDRQIH